MLDRALRLIKSVFPQQCPIAEDLPARIPQPEIAKAKLDVSCIVGAEKARLEAEALARKEQYSTEVCFDTQEFNPDSRFFLIRQAEEAERFGASVLKLIDKKCEGGASECYRRAGVGRQTFSKIVTKTDNQVSKRIAMQLCVGLRLTVEESEVLLSKAGYSFSKSLIEDMAFRWCLEHSVYNILDVSAILVSLKCKPLKLTF